MKRSLASLPAHRLTAAALVVCLAVGVSFASSASPPPQSEEEVHRVLTLLSAVGEEYREGVRDGIVIKPIEFEEAKTFLDDAQRRVQSVGLEPPDSTREIVAAFAAAAAALDGKAPVDTVAATLTDLRQRITALTGVAEQIYPPAQPSAAHGKNLFDQNCANCHGERGDGKGPNAAGLKPPPANFTDSQFIRGETPYDFYHVISLGKTNTAMAAWDGALSVQDRWDLVSYVWTLASGSAGVAEGQGVYLAHCANCHGTTGDGHGTFADVLVKPAPDLSTPQALARKTDVELFTATADGIAATPMPAFARTLRDDERWKAVAFMRILSLGGPQTPATNGSPTSAPPESNDPGLVLSDSGRLLDAAVAGYARGDSRASGTAGDAYLQFDPLEPRLGATEPALKTRIEERFLHMRQLLRVPGNDTEIRSLAAAIHEDFAAARVALQPHASPYALFVESATIILREGFEIVLVIGALVAYVVKTRNPAMQRSVYAGTALGVIASLATAVVMGELLRIHPAASDMLEGFTMLLAAVVLFWVSYWLVSKSEAAKWQRYIRDKVETAVDGGRGVALAGAAFLAVYREGFETVLFYQALYASAPAAVVTITAGFAAGAVALLVVYGLLRRFEVRIPIQQFFFVTGIFLYAMAAIFAGQGIHELQEAGMVACTPLPLVPVLPLLGIYPSVQSLFVQLIFVALFAYATGVTLRRRTHAGTESEDGPIVVELHALRGALETVRDELRMLRAAESYQAESVAERVEGAVLRVERLAGRVARPPANGRANGGRRSGH
jgi:FTR1 family protein